jgi:RNA 3'-terminal phosphate cyclase (ATP)
MGQPLVEIDGSFGEGGGQILRSSLSLSLLTGRPFHLRNIRAGRQKPGLQPQHLVSVHAAAAIAGARLHGDSLNSTELAFEPGPVLPGKYHFVIRTAGATGLVLQTVYLPLALRATTSSEVSIEGGTHVPTSPCFHFLEATWRRYLELLGMAIELRLQRPGFYPRGGGLIEATLEPCLKLRGLHLSERRTVTTARGFSVVAGLPEHIAQRQARRACRRLEEAGLSVDIREESWRGGPGTVLAVILDTEPVPTLFFALGARSKPAERVADEIVDQVLAYQKAAPAAVDAHSADQLILPLAMAEGSSEFRVVEITSHLLTNIAVTGRFLERDIRCEGALGAAGSVRIS